MVQNVRCIYSNLKTLRFTDPKILADIGIERVVPEIANRVLPQSTSLTRQRMLQNNDSRANAGMRDGVAGTCRVVDIDAVGYCNCARRTRRNDIGQGIQCTPTGRATIQVLQSCNG